jgi:hypothetical protein
LAGESTDASGNGKLNAAERDRLQTPTKISIKNRRQSESDRSHRVCLEKLTGSLSFEVSPFRFVSCKSTENSDGLRPREGVKRGRTIKIPHYLLLFGTSKLKRLPLA